MSRLVAAAAAAMVAGLALAGCSSDAPRNSAGQVTAAASVDAFQVTLGDCTGPMKEGNIMSLQVLPCDDAHYFEAYARTELPDGDYPGEDAAQEEADTFCTAEFKTFVGVATKDSSLDMFYMYPLKESWATGDREVLCFAGLDKGGLKGSLKGTKK